MKAKKMIYDNKMVAVRGKTIIDGVTNFVVNYYVKCDAVLNSRAWNTTKSKEYCNKCFDRVEQLKLF